MTVMGNQNLKEQKSGRTFESPNIIMNEGFGKDIIYRYEGK